MTYQNYLQLVEQLYDSETGIHGSTGLGRLKYRAH